MMTSPRAGTDLPRAPFVLVLHGKNIGDLNQAETLAKLLGWPYRTRKLHPRRTEPPDINGRQPDVIIAVDKRSVNIALEMKRRSSHPVKVIKIGVPFLIASHSFLRRRTLTLNEEVDLNIAYEQYTSIPSPKIIQMPLPFSPIDAADLADARMAFPHLAALPQPRIAVLVGGASRYFKWSAAAAAEMGRKINAAAEKAGGSLMITTSYRTGAESAEALLAEIKVPHDAYRWHDGKSPNPLRAYLGYADGTIVSINSIAMVADALNAGKPVSVYPQDAKKFAFLKNIVERFFSVSQRTGVIRRLIKTGEVTWFGDGESRPRQDYRRRYDAVVDAVRDIVGRNPNTRVNLMPKASPQNKIRRQLGDQ